MQYPLQPDFAAGLGGAGALTAAAPISGLLTGSLARTRRLSCNSLWLFAIWSSSTWVVARAAAISSKETWTTEAMPPETAAVTLVLSTARYPPCGQTVRFSAMSPPPPVPRKPQKTSPPDHNCPIMQSRTASRNGCRRLAVARVNHRSAHARSSAILSRRALPTVCKDFAIECGGVPRSRSALARFRDWRSQWFADCPLAGGPCASRAKRD